MTAPERRRDALFDLAVANPTLTVEQMMDGLDTDYYCVKQAIRDLRMFLGEFDSINFPCDPDPDDPNGRWLYRLTGSLDDVRAWAENRVGDAETRLRTMQAMMASIVRATDGRTIEGRRARVMETALRHLVEDLDLLGSAE